MPVPEFSQMLTDRRRQLGYSVGQAARALRLKESVLEAFESGDFASMPKSGYAQGMLSSYARFLGLDAQLVTDLFAQSLDEWRAQTVRGAARGAGRYSRGREPSHGARRSQQSRQPQVPKRGLLPTAGGIAGDLGDYATTSQAHPHAYGRPYGSGEPGYGRDRRTTRSERASGEALRRRGRSEGRDDVTSMPASSDYVDDLRFGNNASPYDPASSERGRASYRNLASTERPERPQVQRRPSTRQRQQVRGRGRRQRPQTFAERLMADPVRFIGLIVVLVAVIITLILILAFSSCSFGTARGDGDRSVPVSQTTTNSSTNSSASANSNNANDKSAEEAAAEQQIASTSANTGDGDSNVATVVEVSVADGSVTWLEIECDGSSKVAETVTGPWDQTYTVTESITIQVGDTTAVTVTKNGKQMQFDSRASGLGTMTIQGTKVATTQTSAAAGTNSTRTTTTNGADASDGSSSGAAKGNASANASPNGKGSDSTSSASGSSGTTAAGESAASDGGTASSGSRSSASMGRAGSGESGSGSSPDGSDASGDYSDDYSGSSDSAY